MAEGSGADEDNSDILRHATTLVHQPSSVTADSNQNMKSEESNQESNVSIPEEASPVAVNGALEHLTNSLEPKNESLSPVESKTPRMVESSSSIHFNGNNPELNNLLQYQNYPSSHLEQNLPTNFPSMPGVTISAANAPLNLTMNTSEQTLGVKDATARTSNMAANFAQSASINPVPNFLRSQPVLPAMPQLILASGQLAQGIQGAQLLIPTSQGIATQTILTIPFNPMNCADQMINLPLTNGQIVTTSLANLAQSSLLQSPGNNGKSGAIGINLLNSTAFPTLISNNSPHHLLQNLPEMLNTSHLTPQTTTLPTLNHVTDVPNVRNNRSVGHFNANNAVAENKGQQVNKNETSPAYNDNTINNRSPTNVDTPMSASSSSSQGLKRPPSSLSLSPACNDHSSTADLLIDSPSQPTINQTNCNVVDGINLEEIKEFAKAFKLRRLSLGLTQTQVGQALSVTEGPAYSQSAICSALASQMLAAAQFSTQQQAMFEKLDITPKSAQKIKPVLERWMKEAEERYKSGQNHLTDFIGVEPSKKRKRRTSFTPQALELLNAHFERNTHPSGTEITGLAHQLGYEREVIRIWFCNKRQALKNTVRMMSKGMV
ncbi:POU domain, class 6, transcription factor 2 isoform X2 [Agrilus planipennis]|uniref:POU domain, class 6, transcription factor 2 isoform X2 n=1 Tax=Agrilus planipennis TaxID=224129 RepID=A0A7F5RAF1_AGRPL|nr:POU domain, class 6, transcription factor 2 isoform X2 [Agrilus planipennis]